VAWCNSLWNWGYVDLILDGDAGQINEEQREFLTVAKRNADRLTMLVGDLLDVSRIESGATKLKLGEINLKSIIQGVADLLRPHMDLKKQTLNIDIPAGLPMVSGDADRIIQILTNLISNANKYTPPGGNISVSFCML
jgi:signal transduction histidine kinase